MTKNFNFKQWLLIGLILRLIVMPFTFHADLFFILLTPMYLIGGEWDAYGIYQANYGHITNGGYYPPLALIYFSLWEYILSFFFDDFPKFSEFLLNADVKGFLASEGQFHWFFLLKIHYFGFDALMVWTILKMLPKDAQSRKTFAVFWAVNPVMIYGTYMVGQFDLIPATLVVLASYLCMQKGKEQYAGLSLGIGCLFKIFPILFLPMILCLACETIKDVFRVVLYAILPVAVIYGVFYGLSGSAVFGLFNAQQHNIAITTSTETITLRVSQGLIYGLVCYHIWKTPSSKLNYSALAQYFMIVYFAIYLGFLVSSVHRYIWVMPFILYWIHNKTQLKKLFYLLLVIIFLGCLRTRSSTLGIFAPLNPQFFLSFPSVKDGACYLVNCSLYFKIITWIFKSSCIMAAGVLIRDLYKSYPLIRFRSNC